MERDRDGERQRWRDIEMERYRDGQRQGWREIEMGERQRWREIETYMTRLCSRNTRKIPQANFPRVQMLQELPKAEGNDGDATSNTLPQLNMESDRDREKKRWREEMERDRDGERQIWGDR